jgi:hypothetical protein
MNKVSQFFKQNYATLALGTALLAGPSALKAQSISSDRIDGVDKSGFVIFGGGGYSVSDNPYKKGTFLSFGAQVPLWSDNFKAQVSTEVFLEDQNQINSGYTYVVKDGNNIPVQAGVVGYTSIPARTRAALFYGSSAENKVQVNVGPVVEVYPGSSSVRLTDANVGLRAEANFDIFKPKDAPAGISVQAYVEAMKFNNNFFNAYHPPGTSAISAGIKISANLFPTYLK